MKIKSVHVTNDDVLGDYSVDFEIFSDKQVHYLVGNNGSGKTRLLELIHDCLSRRMGNEQLMAMDETVEVNLLDQNGDLIAVSMNRNRSRWRTTAVRTKPDGTTESIADDVLPVASAYVPTEANFQVERVTSAPGEVPDYSAIIAMKAESLHKQIPQLLVNLEHLDNADIAREYKTQHRKVEEGTDIPLRVERFKETYAYLMNGSKELKEIRQESGEHRVVFTDANGGECGLTSLSSGEKQVVFRIGFVMAILSPGVGGLILVDEPELSLHPAWQSRYIEALRQLFTVDEVQIMVATHSPFIFDKYDSSHSECIRIDRSLGEADKIRLNIDGSSHSPSAPLVGYKAFGVWTEALHIELFERVLAKLHCDGPTALNRLLAGPPHNMAATNRSASGGSSFAGTNRPATETLPVWVRNYLHHPDFLDRQPPSYQDKVDSTEALLTILA